MGEQYYSNDEVLEFLQKDIKYPGAEEPRMAVDVILGFRINLYIYRNNRVVGCILPWVLYGICELECVGIRHFKRVVSEHSISIHRQMRNGIQGIIVG